MPEKRGDFFMPTLTFPEDTRFTLNITTNTGEVMHSHHYHEFYELYYMMSGSCNYFIDDKVYEVIAGDIVLIPSGVIHRTNYVSAEHTRILIECSDNMVPKSVKRSLSSMLYLYRNTTANKEFYNFYKRLDKEMNNPDGYSLEVVDNMIKMMFYTLARTKSIIKDNKKKNSMIEDVVSYVKENFSQPINLSRVAKDHFISQEHLSRTFKKHTGFGFNEYLTLVRLQHAEQLLKGEEKMSISAIAYSCGFNDSNYFSDKFKKVYGTSPLKFSKSRDTDKSE